MPGIHAVDLEATREICQGPDPLHLEATALKLSLLEGHISTFGSKLVPFCPAFSSYSPTVCKFATLYTTKNTFQTIIFHSPCPYLEGITANNPCILAIHYPMIVTSNILVMEEKIIPILPTGRVAAALVICIA